MKNYMRFSKEGVDSQLPLPNAKLPEKWEWTTLGEIRRDTSQSISQEEMRGKSFELYSVPSFATGKPEIIEGDQIGSNKVTVQPGDVLICKINPRINRAWVVGESQGYPQIASTEWIVFSKQGGIIPDFLRYYFSTDTFRNYLAANVSGVGGSLMRVRPSVVERYPFPLAPTAEQEHIVAKLDAMVSRITAGESAARRALERLDCYRASVLYAAVTGELTREWRKTHKLEETGELLLKRLLVERRKRWEETEFKRLESAGKLPKNDKWKERYKEPEQPDIQGLPKLPVGWTWASIDQLSWTSGYGTSERCSYEGKGLPVLRIPNIRSHNLSFSDIKFAAENAFFDDSELVDFGDLLLIRTNGSRTLIGRAAVVQKMLPGKYSFASYLIRYRLLGESEFWSWVSFAWDSSLLRTQINNKAATTAGQYNVSLSNLASIAIPLPPTIEQQQLIQQIDLRFAASERMQATLKLRQEQASTIRQSLLNDAYSGSLNTQQLGDEPASLLLTRLHNANRAVMRKRVKVKIMPSKKSYNFRQSLIEVLRKENKPIPPEELFRLAGFQHDFDNSDCQQDILDAFYDELRAITEPLGPVKESRPHPNTVLLEINS